MTSAEFLAVVLPSEGFGLYCAVELTKKKEHVYAAKIEELIPTIEQWHANNYDVFYGQLPSTRSAALKKRST